MIPHIHSALIYWMEQRSIEQAGGVPGAAAHPLEVIRSVGLLKPKPVSAKARRLKNGELVPPRPVCHATETRLGSRPPNPIDPKVERMQAVIDKLPDDDRRIVFGFYKPVWLSPEQRAGALDMSPAGMYQRLHSIQVIISVVMEGIPARAVKLSTGKLSTLKSNV